MPLDDEWAADYQRRVNERLFGPGGPYHYPRRNGKSSFFRGPSPDYYVTYDEAFTFGQEGPYTTAFGTSSWGPSHLSRVYRCRCDHPESEHDSSGVCHRPGGFAGICDCGPRTPDPLIEMIESWL